MRVPEIYGVDFVQLVRPEDIQLGTQHHQHLLRMARFVFQQPFALIVGRHWIRRHHYFAQWIHSISRPFEYCI